MNWGGLCGCVLTTCYMCLRQVPQTLAGSVHPQPPSAHFLCSLGDGGFHLISDRSQNSTQTGGFIRIAPRRLTPIFLALQVLIFRAWFKPATLSPPKNKLINNSNKNLKCKKNPSGILKCTQSDFALLFATDKRPNPNGHIQTWKYICSHN